MGKKSYWFKDLPTDNGQKGNFSNNKQDTFNPQDGFIGTRLQQGVPLLDRDWNELEDIRRYQDVMLRQHYLGDGTPNDGFRISALDPLANDFMISAGRFLVEGLEAVNEPAGAKFILYSSQGLPALNRVKATQPPNTTTRNDTVYLDIWIEEVTGKELPRLTNPDDVAMETCIRHRLRWFVRVDEGSLGHSSDNGHHFYDLARITRTSDRDTISSVDIKNLRPVWQTLQSLNAAQSRLKNAINSLISGSMPSDPTMDLVTFPPTGGDSPSLIKDNLGNMVLFWQTDNNIWAKRYSASTRTWGADTLITSGTAVKYYLQAFNDSRGDIWLFWEQQDGSGSSYNFRAKKYSISSGIWTGDIQLTSEVANKYIVKAFEDHKGNVWFFWQQQEGTTDVTNIWAKKYTAGSWSGDNKLTSGTKGNSYNNIFPDSSGAVWLFWQQLDTSSNTLNLWAKRYGDGSWDNGTQLTPSTVNNEHLNSFEDKSGNIWLIWQQLDSANASNIFSKRFKSGSWGGDAILTSGKNSYQNSFVDARGDIWVVWEQLDASFNIWVSRYTSGAWQSNGLTTGSDGRSFPSSFAGNKKDVWIFYSQADPKYYNIWSQRFNFESNAWESNKITSTSGDKYISDKFALSNGDVCIFWYQDNHYVSDMFSGLDGGWQDILDVTNDQNAHIYKIFQKSNGEIWLISYKQPPDPLQTIFISATTLRCIRFIDGDWGESRSISDSKRKRIIDVFEDFKGDIWAFWTTDPINPSVPRQIKAKKIYGSI